MKKILFGMFAASLLLTSCSQDDLGYKAPGEEANVTFKISTPEMGTRAYSDGNTATVLKYAVYEVTGEGDAKTLNLLPNYTNEADEIHLNKSLSFKVVTGKTYGFVFYAESPNSPYTVAFNNDGAKMTVDYTKVKANDENLDAFYRYMEITIAGDGPMEAELRRPFAQINYGTNDFDEAAAVNAVPTQSQIIVTGIGDTLDMVSGEVSNTAQRTWAWNVLPKEETFPVDGYDYLAMAYVLAPKDQQLATVALRHNQANNSALKTLYQVPIQRNYRTNIYGQALTTNQELNIEIVPEYYDDDNNLGAFVYAAATGQNISLTQNEVVNGIMTYSSKASSKIDLNGYSMDLSKDGNFGQIYLRGTNELNLTINGPGTISQHGTDPAGSTSVIYLNNPKATVTINGGNFLSNGVESLYIGDEGGTIIINGGYFACDNTYPQGGKFYTLNCNDNAYKSNIAKFIVKGGTFENFDPANAESENPAANWVAEGYESVKSVADNGKTLYTVVPKGTGVAANYDDALASINAGKDVVLAGNITGDATSGAYGKAKGGLVIKNGQVLDGAGFVFTINDANDTWDSNICINNGTVKNLTVSNGFRGFFVNMDNTGDIYLDNVKVLKGSNITYALNVNEGNGTKNFYATNSVFCGWSSWGNGANLYTFTNCEFGIGNTYTTSNLWQNGVVKPYRNTIFKNCKFDEMIYIDLSSFDNTTTITFDNCTVNGVKLTRENHKILKGAIVYGEQDWEDYDKHASQIIFK